jgi:hypothetical protein
VYLCAILLGGLLLNASFGWWWADSTAASCICVMYVASDFPRENCSYEQVIVLWRPNAIKLLNGIEFNN